MVVMWIGSYFGALSITAYDAGRGHGAVAYAIEGLGEIGVTPSFTPPGPLYYLHYQRHVKAADQLQPTTLGFRFGKFWGNDSSMDLIFPLWLPTLLLSALCWFTWRKTRPKLAGTAFPVEPAAAQALST